MVCVNCGTPLDVSYRICPTCGYPRPLVAMDFDIVEQKALDLLRRYQDRSISAGEYQTATQQNILSDPAGGLWTIDPVSRKWFWYDGTGWVERQPDYAPTPGRIGTAIPPPLKRKHRGLLAAGIAVAAFLFLVYSVGGFILGGYKEYQALPKVIDVPSNLTQKPAVVVLSISQQQIRVENGTPEAFTIYFYQEEQSDGTFEEVRHETWTYYSKNTEYIFINGELAGKDVIATEKPYFVPTRFSPEEFTSGMNPDQVTALIDQDTYLLVPVDDELVRDGRIYYAGQLSWGFKKDKLAFVQGFALEKEGGQ